MEKDREEEIAQRLKAAYFSYVLGIGLEYTLKTYIRDKPTGAFWLELADLVIDAHAHSRASRSSQVNV